MGARAPGNNKCLAGMGICVSVLLNFWLLQASGHPQQQRQDVDRLQELLAADSGQANATETGNQTAAATRAKPTLGLAELNPDASDTVPVYMQHMTIVLCTLHLSVFVTGLVGNSLVCLSVYRNKSLQTITNYYIVNLAVADFLVILICLPPTVIWDLTLTWNFGLVLCKLVLYLQSISVSVSVLTLTCISIDRWYAICRPLKFSSSKSRAKLTIALIWLASLLIASPDVIFLTTSKLYEDEEEDKVYMDCTYAWPEENTKRYQLCIVTLLFILPFVLMIISYSQIVNVLWRNETMAESMQNSFQLEDEAATAAASTANGGGGGGGCKMRGRGFKNESQISTTSAAAVAGGSVGRNGNGVRRGWQRGRRQGVPPGEKMAARGANQCDGPGARTTGLCSSCASATTASRLESVSPSNSSNASNLITPSDSFNMRSRSFATSILKLCRRGCRGGEPKRALTVASKTDRGTCPAPDDAQAATTTTGRLGAGDIRSHHGNNNLAVCQFERCEDSKCLNSDGDGDGNNVVKLSVNNSPATAACFIGIVCSGPTAKSDENMEISAGSLANRESSIASDGGCDDNNLMRSRDGQVITTITVRGDDDELLKQYDNERASPLPTTKTPDKTGAKIVGANGARRWTLSAVSGNDNTSNLGGANHREHASRPAPVGSNPRAECLTREGGGGASGEDKTCDCDRRVKVAGHAITKSCKLHAALDCAQCCAATVGRNHDDDHHRNKINRCHGCRHRPHRRHRHRRATCHELNEPRPASVSPATKIINREIRESRAIIPASANHGRLDVETNEPREPNGSNSNYYTRERSQADKREAKQGQTRPGSVSNNLLASKPHVDGAAAAAAVLAKGKSIPSQAISEMPTSQNLAPITTGGDSSRAGTNKLSKALRPTDGHANAATKCPARSGHEFECLLEANDKNDDDGGGRHRHEAAAAAEASRERNKPSGARPHRHHHNHYRRRHHHHCRQKQTDQSQRDGRHRRVPRLECTPTSDHVLAASSELVRNNASILVAPADPFEASGQDATDRASSELSVAGGGGGGDRQRRVVALTNSGNGSAGPRDGAEWVIRASPVTATTEIKAKPDELLAGPGDDQRRPPPRSLKWPSADDDDQVASTRGRGHSGKLEWTGNGGSAGSKEDRSLVFVVSDDKGDGLICPAGGQQSTGQGDGGGCPPLVHALRKSVTYEAANPVRESPQVPTSWGKAHGWCLECCADTGRRLRSSPRPGAHHYRREPKSESATSLSKQEQQQQQKQQKHRKSGTGANGSRAISCDNRQSNDCLSVRLAPTLANDSARTEPAAGPLSPGLSSCEPLCRDSSLQSINQAANDSKRRAVKSMVATKFLCIKRFVRLIPSVDGAGPHTPSGSSSGKGAGPGGASKCRICRENLTPAADVVGPASERHAQRRETRAPARSSSARSASGAGVQANGAAHQHAQIYNRSSAPLQGSSPANVGAKSCSLVVKTIPPSQQQQQQQQQHNHYPNHPQQPHPQPSHSSTRFYKLIESRKKAAKMLIVIVIMFGLCYLPIHFLNTLRYTTGLPQNDITTIASLVSHWLCYFNSAVNPLIYNFMSGKFRHEFANLFFCRFLRRA